MAWRIDKHVVRGLIQNIVPGRVVGTIWLKGHEDPIELNLKGNCFRDMAGARLKFSNPNAVKGDYTGLDLHQVGRVGDMTASKKVKTLLDPENYVYKSGKPLEFTWANCLYLEWFSEANGRVLIETVDYKWSLSLPKWSLSAKDENEQRQSNMQAMFNFIDELAQALDPKDLEEPPADKAMNEFQWEAYLQKSDVRSDMLLELFEKYEDDPNCEDIIAQAMGWEIESIEVEDETFDDWDETTGVEAEAEDDDYLPNHPLIGSMMDITSRLFYEAESRQLLSDEGANPWNQLVWHGQMTVSKLIAALEQVADGIDTEPGFVIATLKRALHLLHLTIATLEACVSLDSGHRKWTAEIRRDLFALRESVIDLMQNLRHHGE